MDSEGSNGKFSNQNKQEKGLGGNRDKAGNNEKHQAKQNKFKKTKNLT